MTTTTTIAGYLVDVVTRERLTFQYNPSDITDQKGTNYAALTVPGMSHPRYQYVAGEARKLHFSVVFFKGDVKKQVAWLQALLYPTYQGSQLKGAPHRVLLFFGELYPGIECLVRDVTARYSYLFDQQTLLPQRADVELVLEEYVGHSISSTQVR
ncbi:MAG: CIS tube protein [Armatimonadota bacterium]